MFHCAVMGIQIGLLHANDALQKVQGSVVSNRIAMMTCCRNVLGVNIHRLTGVGFLISRHTFTTAAMTVSSSVVRRLPARTPSVCGVLGSLYALQLLRGSWFINNLHVRVIRLQLFSVTTVSYYIHYQRSTK